MDSSNNLEDRLWRIFENVNGWLRYLEQKNTILLTVLGIQITLGTIFKKQLDYWLIASSISLGLCFLLVLLSFFPKDKISQWIYFLAELSEPPDPSDNLLFFGHIPKYSLHEYINKMENYLSGTIHGRKHLEDLCAQISINSNIARSKAKFFKASTWLMIIGQLLLIISFWR